MFILASVNIKAQSESTKKQCTAITVKGIQCKKTATDGHDKCTIHSVDNIRCGATTASGTPCRTVVKSTGDKCRFHKLQPKQ